MNAKHTPTPWTLQQDTTQNYTICADKYTIAMDNVNDSDLMPKGMSISNGKRIVHCVNMHEEMLEALKVLSEYIARHEKFLPETQERDELAEDLIALIDKAKGE
jgi:hypothetical protein